MRLHTALVILVIRIATAQANQDFSGVWKLNARRSDIRALPAPPAAFLKVEQSGTSLILSASSEESGTAATSIYPLDERSEKGKGADWTSNTQTKWEGAALLVSTLVSGPQNYTVMERWTRSRDASTLTIKRTIMRLGSESESLLVYEAPNSRIVSSIERSSVERSSVERPSFERQPRAAEPPPVTEYVVDAGTRVLLRLTNSVNTKRSAAGDKVYLETVVPVFVNGHLVIPRGSYVVGTVTEARQAGRVKGKSALNLRFDTLTLPNGVARDFRSRPSSVDARGNLDRSEGRIEGDGNKAGDAATVGKTTAAGAGIGTLAGASAGHIGMGAGIGAAAGAAAGLAGVLGSRGPEVILPAGTTMELVLDRDLRFTSAELRN